MSTRKHSLFPVSLSCKKILDDLESYVYDVLNQLYKIQDVWSAKNNWRTHFEKE